MKKNDLELEWEARRAVGALAYVRETAGDETQDLMNTIARARACGATEITTAIRTSMGLVRIDITLTPDGGVRMRRGDTEQQNWTN